MIKNQVATAGDARDLIPGLDPWVTKIAGNRKWQPTPVFLPEKPYGQRSLAGYDLWGCKESDMAEHMCTQNIYNIRSTIPTIFKHIVQ